jgi:hypothetical protein
MSDSRSFGSLPSAYAFLSGAVKDSCLQSFMSLCTPESWSSPFSAKSQLAVAPQSDITQLRGFIPLRRILEVRKYLDLQISIFH